MGAAAATANAAEAVSTVKATSTAETVVTETALPAEGHPGRKLWEHPDPESTALYKFKAHISKKYGIEFGSEADENSLWQWSVDNIAKFWGEVWDYSGIRFSRTYDSVGIRPCPQWR